MLRAPSWVDLLLSHGGVRTSVVDCVQRVSDNTTTKISKHMHSKLPPERLESQEFTQASKDSTSTKFAISITSCSVLTLQHTIPPAADSLLPTPNLQPSRSSDSIHDEYVAPNLRRSNSYRSEPFPLLSTSRDHQHLFKPSHSDSPSPWPLQRCDHSRQHPPLLYENRLWR